MTINIVCALYPEAKPLIEFYKLKALSHQDFPVYVHDDMRLIITGSGKISCALGVQSLILNHIHSKTSLPDEIFINIGVCGSKKAELPKGSIHLINQIIDHGTIHRYYPDLNFIPPFSEQTITTFDQPIFDSNNIPSESNLVDMEASGFFQAANHYVHTNQIHLLKIVSDHLTCLKNDAAFVRRLILSNTETIDLFVRNMTSFHLQKPKPLELSSTENELLHKIQHELKLTETQTHTLKNYFHYLKSSGFDIHHEIKQENVHFKHKREKNDYFKKLLCGLV